MENRKIHLTRFHRNFATFFTTCRRRENFTASFATSFANKLRPKLRPKFGRELRRRTSPKELINALSPTKFPMRWRNQCSTYLLKFSILTIPRRVISSNSNSPWRPLLTNPTLKLQITMFSTKASHQLHSARIGVDVGCGGGASVQSYFSVET